MNTETKTCKICGSGFRIEPDSLSLYERLGVPPPGQCPLCRMKRRLQFRNEMSLYNRKCGSCGKDIIAMYHPQSPYVVYCGECWESDRWDPFAYGADYNPARPFWDQLGELFRRVPKKATHLSRGAGPSVNSEYTNLAGSNKNCYLVFNTGNCEDCSYSRGIRYCRDTLDAYFGSHLERCYETVNGEQCAGVAYGHNVNSCLDSCLLANCANCQNCFGCVNLRHKSYHFFNEPLAKGEYERRVGEIRGSYRKTEEAKRRFREFRLKFPHKENTNFKTVDSTGDYLIECKNLRDCFELMESEDCRHCVFNKALKDSEGAVGYGFNSELLLECVGVGYSSRILGTYWADNSSELEYCFALNASKNCLGCEGLRNAQYCILNKKYAAGEFRAWRSKIAEELRAAGEWGAFFPPRLAPFAYNETIAQDNFPLSREQALAEGFRWEEDIQVTAGRETLRADQLPDRISEAGDGITEEILACASCRRNYKITPAELAFYRRMVLPLPRNCFFCRHRERLKLRGPQELFDRSCARCAKPIRTNFAPDRPEIVYCEACYQQEVV